jgi:hypothetical protein
MRRTAIPVLLLIFTFNVQVSFAQTGGANRAQAARNAADREWPRGFSLPSEAQIVLYEPQIASWDNQKHLVAYAAVSHVGKGEQKPALGTVRFETDTEVSLEQRLVKFSKIKITETNFQTLSKEQTQERGGSEKRSAANNHHPNTGHPSQLRRRANLEPDQGQRTQVCSKYQLGRLPAPTHRTVLPALRNDVVKSNGHKRLLVPRRQAA